MKRQNKKGFTIVELVIVIAVIAILAAVLIPTFSNIIKRANESKDTQLVRNLNTALATDALNKHTTIQSALDCVAEAGYIVEKINASNQDNEILWDSENDVFVYLMGEAIEYIPGSVEDSKKISDVNSYKLWQIVEFSKFAETTRSIYAAGTDWTGEVNVKAGFDAGKNTNITSVTYIHEGAEQKVVICTASAKTSLTINASADTVYHYGAVGAVDIIKTANGSYHENGVAAFIKVASGRVVAEAGSQIAAVVLTEKGADATLPAIIENNGGIIETAYATSEEVITANNADAKSVQLTAENKVESTAIEEIKNEVVSEAVKEEEKEKDVPSKPSTTIGTTADYVELTGKQVITNQDEFVAAINAIDTSEELQFTLYLGEGTFSLPGLKLAGKNILFSGSGCKATIIDTHQPSGDGNGGYGATCEGTLAFENVQISADNSVTYNGFTCCAGLSFNNCYFETGISNWGNQGKDVTFINCTFKQTNTGKYNVQELRSNSPVNAPITFTFSNCLFESAGGRFINAYKQGGEAAKLIVKINNCKFVGTKESKSAVNMKTGSNGCILDVYFTGENTAEGVKVNAVTGSALFMDEEGTNGKVYIDGTLVWANGAKVGD